MGFCLDVRMDIHEIGCRLPEILFWQNHAWQSCLCLRQVCRSGRDILQNINYYVYIYGEGIRTSGRSRKKGEARVAAIFYWQLLAREL